MITLLFGLQLFVINRFATDQAKMRFFVPYLVGSMVGGGSMIIRRFWIFTKAGAPCMRFEVPDRYRFRAIRMPFLLYIISFAPISVSLLSSNPLTHVLQGFLSGHVFAIATVSGVARLNPVSIHRSVVIWGAQQWPVSYCNRITERTVKLPNEMIVEVPMFNDGCVAPGSAIGCLKSRL